MENEIIGDAAVGWKQCFPFKGKDWEEKKRAAKGRLSGLAGCIRPD